MSPENQWLEDEFPIEIVIFLSDMLVFGGVYNAFQPEQESSSASKSICTC